MASLNPTAACFARNETLSQHQGHAQPYPCHPNTGGTTAPYMYQVDQTTVLTALHRRIAVLETQLTQAYTGKQQADQAAQYLLHIATKDHGATACPTVDQEDIQRLQRKLRRSQEENFELRLKLRKAVMLWGNHTRKQMISSRSHDTVPVGCAHARPTCPKDIAETSCSTQNNSENTLVDLLDCLSVDDLPELDDSDGESENDDDLESLSSHVQGLPQINLGAYGDCVVQDARKASFTGSFERSGSAHIRHLSSKESTTIEKAISGTKELKEQSVVTISTPPKAKIAISPPGVYTEQKVPPRNVRIHGNSLYPVKKSLAIDPQDATCGPDKLFSSVGERHTAIQINRNIAGPEDLIFPDLFRYGVQYMPSLQQSNTLRTISIMNLPPEISRSKLLSSIRGGIIVSVDLLDTVSITGAFSALVVFLHGQDALAFNDFVAENTLHFGGQKACVKLLTTPTWPLSLNLSTAIFQHHHTRCLEVFNYPHSITPAMLRKDLRLHQSQTHDAIERIQMRSDNVLEIQLMSIQAAGRAYGKLTNMRAYKQCHVVFAKDPCALPLEILRPKLGATISSSPSAPNDNPMMRSKAVEAEITQLPAPTISAKDPDSSDLNRGLYTSVWAPPVIHRAPTDSNEFDSIPLLLGPRRVSLLSPQQASTASSQNKVFVPPKPIEVKELASGGLAKGSLADDVPEYQIATDDSQEQNLSPANPTLTDEPIGGTHTLVDLTNAEPSDQTESDNDTKSIITPANSKTVYLLTNEPHSAPDPTTPDPLPLNNGKNESRNLSDMDVQEYLDEHMNEIDCWADLGETAAPALPSLKVANGSRLSNV